ncbi:MAG: type III-B CRISPR module-associated protein Cmr5 [Zoogloeaceae bacterium]|jgi:CRISPR-associated protein Cmr5|nr:type III-B CRISPR module-associated protein Cmr5 [Zoogloeaceae bacterium]
MATLEQERAQFAWECAQESIGAHNGDYGDYVNDTKGLPALIMNSGLMQVMAFLHEKGGRHETLGKHLRDWLHERYQTPADFNEFMEELLAMEPRRFQDITAEALAWLKWLRQIAPALQN